MKFFIDKRDNRDNRDNRYKRFIQMCEKHTKTLDSKTEDKKRQIRLLFAEESVFREFRVISKSRFKLINPYDLFQGLVTLLKEQFDLLKNNAPLSEQSKKNIDATLAAVKLSIDSQVPNTLFYSWSYSAYIKNMNQLNDHVLRVFQDSRIVSMNTFITLD